MAGFLSRVSRVVRGKAHESLDSLEDATFETTLKQTMRDMQTELNKVIRASAEAMSNHNKLEAKYNRYVEQATDWKEKAKKALGAGNEDLAKKALAKKSECDTQIDTLKSGVEEAEKVREKLKSQVEALRRRIEDARRNSSTLIARKNAANAQKKVAKVLAGVSEGDNAFAMLDNFEQMVEKDEATARAYEDLSISDDDELKKEFATLDVSNTDSELDALKAEIEAAKK